jgi:hypothetical protein
LAGFLFISAFACIPAGAAEFVPGINDLPLMPGLGAAAEESVVFDTPAGRIIEATAHGEATADDVLKFYARTLPQLGWSEVARNQFRREDEVLRIEFPRAEGGGIMVRFSLVPATK